MSGLFLLSERQMARLSPFFPLSHGVPRVDDLLRRAPADPQLQAPAGDEVGRARILGHVKRVLVAHVSMDGAISATVRPRARVTPIWGGATRKCSSTCCAARVLRSPIQHQCFQILPACCARSLMRRAYSLVDK